MGEDVSAVGRRGSLDLEAEVIGGVVLEVVASRVVSPELALLIVEDDEDGAFDAEVERDASRADHDENSIESGQADAGEVDQWQVLQDLVEQVVQELEAVLIRLAPPPIPKAEMRFCTSAAPHSGQVTAYWRTSITWAGA